MDAVRASPAASDADMGLYCGTANNGTPRPTTTTNRVPRASAESLARRRGWTSPAAPDGCPASGAGLDAAPGAEPAGTGFVMVWGSFGWGSGAASSLPAQSGR